VVDDERISHNRRRLFVNVMMVLVAWGIVAVFFIVAWKMIGLTGWFGESQPAGSLDVEGVHP